MNSSTSIRRSPVSIHPTEECGALEPCCQVPILVRRSWDATFSFWGLAMRCEVKTRLHVPLEWRRPLALQSGRIARRVDF